MPMQDFHKVAGLEHEIQAQALQGVLEDRGIPHRIRSYRDSAYAGIFQQSKGWGIVEAPDAFHGEILEVLGELEIQRSNGEAEPETRDEE